MYIDDFGYNVINEGGFGDEISFEEIIEEEIDLTDMHNQIQQRIKQGELWTGTVHY